MTTEQVNAINFEQENNIEALRQLVKFWQEKKILAEFQLKLFRGNLSEEQIRESFNLDRIKEMMKVAK